MKAVIQRVTKAKVTVDGKITGEIGKGFLVLLGVVEGDTVEEMKLLAKKTAGIRIFTDENDKMNRSVLDVSGEMLIVSQFTLCGDCKKGTRPSFDKSASPEIANELYEKFCQKIECNNIPVEKGVFGADMQIEQNNDGPVTILLES